MIPGNNKAGFFCRDATGGILGAALPGNGRGAVAAQRFQYLLLPQRLPQRHLGKELLDALFRFDVRLRRRRRLRRLSLSLHLLPDDGNFSSFVVVIVVVAVVVVRLLEMLFA